MSTLAPKANSATDSTTTRLQDPPSSKLTPLFIAAVLVCVSSVVLALFARGPLSSLFRTAAPGASSPASIASTTIRKSVATPLSLMASSDSALPDNSAAQNRTPVYFFSHGGPTFMYSDKDSDGGDLGAFNTLRKIGKEIVEKVKPKAVVVFSAHWQSSKDTIEVNSAEITDLIYDFYGFPSYMYKEEYPNVGSQSVAQKVINQLQASGIKAKAVNRGLDHGVWVPFKVAFPPETNPLKVPVIQVSLFKTEDPNQHVALGKALAPLRDENILIIGSGMTVHNLREMGYYWGSVAPYAKKFDTMVENAVEYTGEQRENALAGLIKTSEANKAHPTKEHLLPIYIAAGAAYNEKGTLLYTSQTSSLAWGEYRFGAAPKN
ncbi:aromatic ring-opening dioxygenase LigB subunit [Myxozyma melibiosi]|uniref:Aromatic ring-opening dioxygenase LigB subunit n=1 Tax=Myxozyma melibiosi TaxID=54550 RepID=A0ABR1FFU2_9ASCO